MKKKINNTNKGFVLPSAIFSILVISIFALMMLTFVTMTTSTNRLFTVYSNNKLISEQIFADFKDGLELEDGLDFEYENIETEIYYCENCDENEDLYAIIARKNGIVICFGIYDLNSKETICYQTKNFCYENNENDDLIYGDLIFKLNNEDF